MRGSGHRGAGPRRGGGRVAGRRPRGGAGPVRPGLRRAPGGRGQGATRLVPHPDP
ncbi:DUF349 domain-containing protein, partial [Streptomyces palmae]